MTMNTDSNGNYTTLTGSTSEISAGTYSVAVGCVISVYVPVAALAQIFVTVSDTSYGISSTTLTVIDGSEATYKAFSGIIVKTGSFTVTVAAADGSGSVYTFNAVDAVTDTASDLYLFTSDGLPVQVASAIRDELGQKIASNYIKSITASGRTLTLTKGNGTTSTITTQDNNTDTKVTQSNSTKSANRPILLKNGTGTSTTTTTALFDSDVYVNPSTGTINATKYTGGTATTSESGLMSASDKSKLDGIEYLARAMTVTADYNYDPENIQTDSVTANQISIGNFQIAWCSGCAYRNNTWFKTTVWFNAFKSMAYSAVATLDDCYQHNLWSYQVRVQRNGTNNCTLFVTNGNGNNGTPTQDCRWTFIAIGLTS
jgi:hypothetical protein